MFHRRFPIFVVPLLFTVCACKKDDTDDSPDLDPPPPATNEPTSSPTSPEQETSAADDERPRRVDIGDELEDTIGFPGVQADVAYETDWYVFRGVDGQSVTFRVEATADSQLRPMLSVLIPGDGPRGQWEQVAARRAAADEPSIELTVTLRSAGTRLVAVDDARNVVEDGDGPESPVGGEAFGYRLVVTPAEGPSEWR